MPQFTLRPLTKAFGAEVLGLELADVTAERGYPELRALFERHSALLFRNQSLDNDQHIALGKLFGPIEDREAGTRGPGQHFKVPEVTNIRADGGVTDENDLHTLNLKANMLWHADSTFLPIPALTNILMARIVTSTGGATEFASTRAAWADMPEALKSRIRGRHIHHHYSQSRKRISPELAKLPKFHMWPAQRWNAVWTNPVNGREALYIASHAFAVDGYEEAEALDLLDELVEFCTQPQYVYSHTWAVGDVLMWDQRAVLHRGTPWPWHEPRKLSSVCVSVQDSDGLPSMRLSA